MQQYRAAPLLRQLLIEQDQIRVLRWRRDWQAKSRRPNEVRRMREDNVQHYGMMIVVGKILLDEARARADTSHDTIDFELFVDMCRGHDEDETLLGDHRQKDVAYYQREAFVQRAIEARDRQNLLSASVRKEVRDEYHAQKSPTSHFTKAIDELQAWVYIIYTRGFDETKRNFSNLESIKGYRRSKPFVTTRQVMDLAGHIIHKPSFVTASIRPMLFDLDPR